MKFSRRDRRIFRRFKSEVPLEYKKRSGEYYRALLNNPTAITLGTLDTVVPPDNARRLAQTIQKIGGPFF